MNEDRAGLDPYLEDGTKLNFSIKGFLKDLLVIFLSRKTSDQVNLKQMFALE